MPGCLEPFLEPNSSGETEDNACSFVYNVGSLRPTISDPSKGMSGRCYERDDRVFRSADGIIEEVCFIICREIVVEVRNLQ